MRQEEERELESIDLIEYAQIAWKHRWLIIASTVILAVLAGVVSLLLPKYWEVEAIILPATFVSRTGTGELREIAAASPVGLSSQINQRAYDSRVAAEMNIEIENFPKITADNLRNTNLVRVKVREQNPQQGRMILLALFNRIKTTLDKKINESSGDENYLVEQTKRRIHDLNINKQTLKSRKEAVIKGLEGERRLVDLAEHRVGEIEEEMKSVKRRIGELDDLQRKKTSENNAEAESLVLFLYSNEVEQNVRYIGTLEDRVNQAQVAVENYKLLIADKEQALHEADASLELIESSLSNAENEIKMFEDRKNLSKYSELFKEPTPSHRPVSPRKKRIVLIAGLLGFCLSLGIAVFAENLKKRKGKGNSNP